MRGVIGVLVATGLTAFGATAWAGDALSVTIVAGDSPKVQVATTGGPVWIPDCRGVVWERFVAGTNTFTPIPGPACGATELGQRVEKAPVTFPFLAEVTEPMVVRAVVVAGQDCREGQPFVLAECRKVTSWQSATVNVRPRADKGK